jgi:hypothetical protein
MSFFKLNLALYLSLFYTKLWVGIIFDKIIHLAFGRCKIMTDIMPTHVKISIDPGINRVVNNVMK